jgi:hypothetical protein
VLTEYGDGWSNGDRSGHGSHPIGSDPIVRAGSARVQHANPAYRERNTTEVR